MLLFFAVISVVIIPLLCLFLGLQVISLGDYVRSGFTERFNILLDYTRYKEYPEFLYLILFLSLMTIVSFLWNALFSYNARQKHKHRFKTLEERKRVSHLAWTHEAKKGTTRIEFDHKGQNRGDRTLRGRIDLFFDAPKRFHNRIIELLRLPDVRKLNTLHTWKIEDRKVHRRAGPPIVTRRNAVWVDAEDTHTMISGTTRAGKGFFIISILLQIIRMCGESVIIMDVKGEHYKTHAQSFMDDGYDVLKVDFIEPKKSLRWNPFGIIIEKYREAYERYVQLLELPNNRKILQEISTNNILINSLKKEKSSDAIETKIKALEEENRNLNDLLPKPNYSEAQELISDIAMRLCHEEDARDPFWSSSATTILEGYINFLLEEQTKDENEKLYFLPDEMINMRSVKMLHELGRNRSDIAKKAGCSSNLEYYLKHYRKTTDMSYMKLNEFINAPENTRGSISAVFADKIKYFLTNEDILRMTSVSDFDIKQLGERKTAIFIAIHDEKGTYHELPSILISQIYEELIKSARKEKNSRLRMPVHVVWDEFANGAKWDNVVNALTAGLSRGVRFYLVIQDFAQLITRYGKDKASTIRSNCQNLYYLLSGESETLEEISKLCGSKIVWNHNRQEKELVPVMSMDALQKLNFGEAVIIRQRKNPYKVRLKRFDRYGFRLPETAEPEERELPDTPVFDISKAMKNRQEKEKPQEQTPAQKEPEKPAEKKKVAVPEKQRIKGKKKKGKKKGNRLNIEK